MKKQSLKKEENIETQAKENNIRKLNVKKSPVKKSDVKSTAVPNNIINFSERKEEELILNKNLSVKERNEIIEKYLPMIQCIARRISSRLPAHIHYNDLISNGVIGLMDAIKKYDPSRNNKFKTYAEFRVRGAILDALRSQDWTPRSIRDKAKRIDKATKFLEQKFSRPPEEKEIAEALEVSLEDYHAMLDQTREVSVISIDESSILNHTDKDFVLKMLEDTNSSMNKINRKSVHKIIINAIKELPERQRIVLSLYYYEEFNLRKIGQILKVTESRVSQLHAQAIERLKHKLMNRVEKEDLNAA